MVVDIIFAVLGVGGTLLFMGYLIYLAIVGAPERDREVAAREHLRRTGHWPDEEAAESADSLEPAADRSARTRGRTERAAAGGERASDAVEPVDDRREPMAQATTRSAERHPAASHTPGGR